MARLAPLYPRPWSGTDRGAVKPGTFRPLFLSNLGVRSRVTPWLALALLISLGRELLNRAPKQDSPEVSSELARPEKVVEQRQQPPTEIPGPAFEDAQPDFDTRAGPAGLKWIDTGQDTGMEPREPSSSTSIPDLLGRLRTDL